MAMVILSTRPVSSPSLAGMPSGLITRAVVCMARWNDSHPRDARMCFLSGACDCGDLEIRTRAWDQQERQRNLLALNCML